MNSKSVSNIFPGILVVFVLSIGVEITIARPRIHVLRAMNSGLRHLARNTNRGTPTAGSFFSGERAFTYYPSSASSRAREQFVPSQPIWNRTMTQWTHIPGGKDDEISKMNSPNDHNKTPSIDEGGSSIRPSHAFGDHNGADQDQQESPAQKLNDEGNVEVKNTPSEARPDEINVQSDTRRLTEVGDGNTESTTFKPINSSKVIPAQSESPKQLGLGRVKIEENETQSLKTELTVKTIENGKAMDINIVDYPTFKSHKTYVIQFDITEGFTCDGAGGGGTAVDITDIFAQLSKCECLLDNNPKMPTTYYWIGKESSDKDAGEAAAQAVRLDSQVQKRISVCREAEGKESRAFRALFKHLFKHNDVLQGGDRPSKAQEEELKKLVGEMKVLFGTELKNITGEQQIIEKPHHYLTPENVQKYLDQTEIASGDLHENAGYQRFDVEIFRIYGRHEWSLTDWSVKDERSITHHVPIKTLNSQDCYLTDSHSNVGLLLWMGKDAETFVRAESARMAELHLRKRKYDHTTPITLFEQEDVPPQVETLEGLVHFIEPLVMNDVSMYEGNLQTRDGAFENGNASVRNGNDDDESSSSSSSDDEN